ncbi:MAG TPA: cation transporter [Terriglobales bacterium]|nr:cation transporter [Terriglobales bacterium]
MDAPPITFDRAAVSRRGRRLEIFTILWNSAEAVVALVAGAVAGSISLVGFGIDSLIEVTSGAALLWRMGVDDDPARRERIEQKSLKIVGGCFVALALYIAYEAVETLWRHQAAERSLPGIVLAAVSLAAMPLLSRAKRRVAASLNSAAMAADAKQTEFCAYLSAILLAGLLLNAALGWWWADPVAALLMVPIIANEGREALTGKRCSCD